MATESRHAQAAQVAVTDDTLTVDLVHGRTVSVPLAWHPRLAHGTPANRSNWCLIGRSEGIHWETLDEDISIDALLAGQASNESQSSLENWLHSRKRAV